jgi:hypothetical protein
MQHHQVPPPYKSSMHHHPQHPPLSNQLQPINSNSHTTMWLDDPYANSNACPSQRDSGFNSRPASLRSIESTSTASGHHGTIVYEQNPPAPPLSNDLENTHPQYSEMQSTTTDVGQVMPELLNLLMEDDPVIIREAVLLTHMLIREGNESRSEVIRNHEVKKSISFIQKKNLFILLVNSYIIRNIFKRYW